MLGKSIDKKRIKEFEKYNLEYPIGCIIAKANLTDCIEMSDSFRNTLKEKNPLVYAGVIKEPFWNGYGFKLENIEKIPHIEINGKLSLWEYEYN